MNSRKTVIRFFTIADYEEEEVWLHNQHKNGWKLSRMIPPCFYILRNVRQRMWHTDLIIKTMQRPVTIFRFLGIMVGNILVDVLGGCIFANRHQRRIPNRMAKFSLTTNQGLT